MPLPPPEHGTTNRWRAGDRCELCTGAHNVDTRDYRRGLVSAAFPLKQRRKVLRMLEHGHSPKEAAEAVGMQVMGLYRFAGDPDWQSKLDAALMAGRKPGDWHGRPVGYRVHKCKCPECRAAHHKPK